MNGPDVTDLTGVLTWLAGAGLSVWCVMVSDFFRNYESDWWDNVTTAVKQAIVIAAMALPPSLAYVILETVPQAFLDSLAPHYAFIAALMTAILVARGAFELAKHVPGEVIEVEYSDPVIVNPNG